MALKQGTRMASNSAKRDSDNSAPVIDAKLAFLTYLYLTVFA